MIPLGLLSPGERGDILAISAHKAPSADRSGSVRETCDCRMEEMGLRIGKRVEMLNNGGNGAILLRVDESRIAVDRSMAMKIMVKEVTQ